MTLVARRIKDHTTTESTWVAGQYALIDKSNYIEAKKIDLGTDMAFILPLVTEYRNTKDYLAFIPQFGGIENRYALWGASGTQLENGGLEATFLTTTQGGVDPAKSEGIATNHVTLNELPYPLATNPRTLRWNSTKHCAEIETDLGVTLQIGQENNLYAKNDSGAIFYNGEIGYISGASGGFDKVKKFIANGTIDKGVILVMCTTVPSVAINAFALWTKLGEVNDLDTSTYNDGDILYASASVAGGVTKIKPSGANDQVVYIGQVSYSHAVNGRVIFYPQLVEDFDKFLTQDKIVTGSWQFPYGLKTDNIQAINSLLPYYDNGGNSIAVFDTVNKKMLVGSGTTPVNTIHSDGSLGASQLTNTGSASLGEKTFIFINSAGATTQTLPTLASSVGRFYFITNIGAGACTLKGNGVETIRNQFSTANTQIIRQNESVLVFNYTTYWYIIDLANASMMATNFRAANETNEIINFLRNSGASSGVYVNASNGRVYATSFYVGVGGTMFLTGSGIQHSTAALNFNYTNNATVLRSLNGKEIWLRAGTDADNIVIKTDGTMQLGTPGTNYTEFEANGFQENIGTAMGWLDIRLPLLYRFTGVGNPSRTAFVGNIFGYTWAENDTCDIDFCEQDHNFKQVEASGKVHIHLYTNGLDATARYLKFTFEYTNSNFGEVATATTITSPELEIPANTPDRTYLIFDIGDWTTKNVGAGITAVLKRVTATGTAPTNAPFIGACHIHAKVDTPSGSRNIMSK